MPPFPGVKSGVWRATGSGNLPPFEGDEPLASRISLIDQIRQVQRGTPYPVDDEIDRAHDIFTGKIGVAFCHDPLDGISLLEEFEKNGNGNMGPFETGLSFGDAGIHPDLSTHLNSLQGVIVRSISAVFERIHFEERIVFSAGVFIGIPVPLI